MADLKQRVIDVIVKKLGVEESQVTETANFTKDLGADSLDTVELIMELENEFNVSIEESEADKIQTVGDVMTFISAKQA
jgi:acyl carrier protein